MADLHATMRLDRERPGDAFTLLVEPDPWTVALSRDDALAVAGVLTSGGQGGGRGPGRWPSSPDGGQARGGRDASVLSRPPTGQPNVDVRGHARPG
jgi:hypothetical protein